MKEGPKPVLIYRFGSFEVDLQLGELQRKGVRVKLQEQPFQLLTVLLENAGEIVSRDAVRQRLWPSNTFVDFDASLSVAIGKLREALGDAADNPRFIETIPRRGYRFVSPVSIHPPIQLNPGDAPSSDEISVLASGGPAWGSAARRYLVVSGVAALILGLGLYTLRSVPRSALNTAEARNLSSPVKIRRSVAVLGFRNLPGRRADDWLSSAFCEMLNTELAAGGDLRMVPGEDVARAKNDLPLTDEDSLGRSTLHRLRINPGADVVVIGSYTMLGIDPKRRIRLDVRLQD